MIDVLELLGTDRARLRFRLLDQEGETPVPDVTQRWVPTLPPWALRPYLEAQHGEAIDVLTAEATDGRQVEIGWRFRGSAKAPGEFEDIGDRPFEVIPEIQTGDGEWISAMLIWVHDPRNRTE